MHSRTALKLVATLIVLMPVMGRAEPALDVRGIRLEMRLDNVSPQPWLIKSTLGFCEVAVMDVAHVRYDDGSAELRVLHTKDGPVVAGIELRARYRGSDNKTIIDGFQEKFGSPRSSERQAKTTKLTYRNSSQTLEASIFDPTVQLFYGGPQSWGEFIIRLQDYDLADRLRAERLESVAGAIDECVKVKALEAKPKL